MRRIDIVHVLGHAASAMMRAVAAREAAAQARVAARGESNRARELRREATRLRLARDRRAAVAAAVRAGGLDRRRGTA
jgi:hypothetical protein